LGRPVDRSDESLFLGGVREDAEEFKKRLIASPPPEYPQLARKAGLQGVVRMQVRVKTDGSLSVDKIIEGERRWQMPQRRRSGNGGRGRGSWVTKRLTSSPR